MTTAAPTQPDQQQRPEPARDLRIHRDPLDQFIPDPCGLTRLGHEPEFAAILESTVADEAPRLFAIVQEYGVPWYAASVPWVLHRCRQQTIVLWWERRSDGWFSQFSAGGTLFCACGGTADLNTDSGWRGRNESRSACTTLDQEATVKFCLTSPHQRIESPAMPSVRSALRVMAGR